jgi:hypothetical protein
MFKSDIEKCVNLCVLIYLLVCFGHSLFIFYFCTCSLHILGVAKELAIIFDLLTGQTKKVEMKEKLKNFTKPAEKALQRTYDNLNTWIEKRDRRNGVGARRDKWAAATKSMKGALVV